MDIPQAFLGNSSAKVIYLLLIGMGEQFFPSYWNLRHFGVEVDPEEFGVHLRRTYDDAIECVVSKPPIYGNVMGAQYVGIHAPEDVTEAILDTDGEAEVTEDPGIVSVSQGVQQFDQLVMTTVDVSDDVEAFFATIDGSGGWIGTNDSQALTIERG